MKVAPDRFINRELSWLAFNSRVLAEAEREDMPLLERLRFMAIVASNLDEFFMIRVAMAHRALDARTGPLGPDGLTPAQTLERIREETHRLVRRQYECFGKSLLPALRKERIRVIRARNYSPEDRAYLAGVFQDETFPALTPLAVDPSHPFPLLSSCAVYLLLRLEPRAARAPHPIGQAQTVLVQIPTGMNRFIRLPAPKGVTRTAVLDDVIALFASQLLGGRAILGAHPFRVTRDADITVDEEQVDDLLEAIEHELRSRRRGEPVRLEVLEGMPAATVASLQTALNLAEGDTFRCPGLLDLKGLFGFSDLLDRADLRYPPWPPQKHPRLNDDKDIFTVVREGDLLLQHPYHAFDPVVELVTKASEDPNVLAIKITLYRVSGNSPLVRALVRAAEAGKQVTALVELRARFDEEANIRWARELDAAGAHVVYGVAGHKTHSKALLIVRRESDGLRRYVHLSTGNYNDRTARLYTDIGYLTARAEFGTDLSAFFNVLTGYSLPPQWHHIEMAPTGLRQKILALIEREREKHTPETPGFIRAKMNSLIDAKVISALYRAGQAGVKVELVVRGLCRLRAGVPGLSENIRVVSVVGRMLEHSRIFHFRNGGNEEVYLSSADMMERNLDRRLELIFPVLDPQLKQEVCHVLDVALSDNTQAWELKPDNTYERVVVRERRPPLRSQDILYREACQALASQSKGPGEGIFHPREAREQTQRPG